MAQNRSSLRKALTKLFSNKVIVKNADGKKIQNIDLNKTQAISNNYVQDKYKRAYSGASVNGFGGGQMGRQGGSYGFNINRQRLFRSYEQMDEDPIISSALDVYANEVATKNEFGKVLSVHSDNGQIKSILQNLFFDILNIQTNARMWARELAKYGDYFLKLHVHTEVGVIDVSPVSAYSIRRIEPERKGEQTLFQIESEKEGIYKDWEIAHFRFINDGNYFPYGKAIIENGRKVWKQLSLTEEAMLIHRIMRAPEKRVFKIDVGNLEPNAVESHMNNIIQDVKQTPLIDPQTGEYNLEFNMMNMLEDFWFPVRDGQSNTEVRSLNGLQYQATEDVEYLRKKLMSALKIPNAFLGYERDIQGKATLAQESIKFANSVRNLQESIVSELKKIAVIHLRTLGFNGQDLYNFNVNFTNPSIVAEQERIDFLSRKVSLARDMKDNSFFSTDYIFKNIFDMSEDEIERNNKLIIRDKKRDFRREQISREGNDPVKTGKSRGTPADLASMGRGAQTQIPTNGSEESEDQEDAEQTSNMPDDVTSGLRDISNQLRTKRSDFTHNYQGGGPMALSHVRPKNKSLIKESLKEISESPSKTREKELEVSEHSYMSESVIENLPDPLEINEILNEE